MSTKRVTAVGTLTPDNTQIRRPWAEMSDEERKEFVRRFTEDNEYGDIYIEGATVEDGDRIEAECPFGLATVEWQGKLALVIVGEYSGPIPPAAKRAEMWRKVAPKLWPVILPDTVICTINERSGDEE